MKKISIICLTLSLSLLVNQLGAQTQVTYYTTKGSFIVKMEDAKRPITTKNFLDMVKAKFYDGLIFHRVINNFMIQGGDPTGTGTGGNGKPIVDELTPAFPNLQKTIAMANRGPNTAECQFFINLVNNSSASFDGSYVAFGTVISNFSVVQAIGSVPVNANDRPFTNVVMDSLRITYSPTTGIDEIANESLSIDVFPNPITNESIISINSDSYQTANVSIYNQLGCEVYSGKKNLSAGTTYISFKEIQTKNLSQGVYYVTVTGNNSILHSKFAIIR